MREAGHGEALAELGKVADIAGQMHAIALLEWAPRSRVKRYSQLE